MFDCVKDLAAEAKAKQNNLEIYKISAVTGQGLNELFNHVAEIIKTLPKEEIVDIDERIVYTLDEDKEEFTVEIIDNGYEVGNHTQGHNNFSNIDSNKTQEVVGYMYKK